MTTSSLRRNNDAHGKALILFDSQIRDPGGAVSKDTVLDRMTASSSDWWTSFVVAPPPLPHVDDAAAPTGAEDVVDPGWFEHSRGYMGSTASAMSAVENWRKLAKLAQLPMQQTHSPYSRIISIISVEVSGVQSVKSETSSGTLSTCQDMNFE